MVMSVCPAAGQGTINVMGRDGKVDPHACGSRREHACRERAAEVATRQRDCVPGLVPEPCGWFALHLGILANHAPAW
jgi:hypothetical protein